MAAKKTILLLLLTFVIASCAVTDEGGNLRGSASATDVAVSSPAAGDRWVLATNQNIMWTIPDVGSTATVTIKLQSCTNTKCIAKGTIARTTNTGKYVWRVGKLTSGTAVPGRYRVQVCRMLGCAVSETFEITSSTIKRPIITTAQVSPARSAWKVTVTGKNLKGGTATLKEGSVQWGGAFLLKPRTSSTTVSFTLPGTSPPSRCNRERPCNITLTIITTLGESNPVNLTLPRTISCDDPKCPATGSAACDGAEVIGCERNDQGCLVITTRVSCDDQSICTAETCAAGACSRTATNEGATCSLPGEEQKTCQAGACVPVENCDGDCTATEESIAVSEIKSVTFYDFPATQAQSHADLVAALPSIKAGGYNTVWLVNPWHLYEPSVSPVTYKPESFTQLRATLEELRQNNMHAIIGLNYLGSGWSPSGINPCNWTQDPTMYAAFKNYATHFLNEIQDYNDTAFILVFTEGTEGCGQWKQTSDKQAVTLRQTLGNLPTQLPSELRQKFLIGYHDWTLINTNGGPSPIATPIPFDFVSAVAYGLDTYDTQEIDAELAIRAERFHALFPDTPLIIGEFGSSACNGNDDRQARVNRRIVEYSLDHDFGFNLWGWMPCGSGIECSVPACDGLGITNPDGTQKPAVAAVIDAISGSRSTPYDIARPTLTITTGGVVTSYSPWAVWIKGSGLEGSVFVQLRDTEAQWDGYRSVTVSQDKTGVTFGLPSNTPPSHCNNGKSCTIQVRLVRPTGEVSNTLDLTLPANS